MNSIADIVSGAGLQMWAELALVLFLIAFGTVITQILTARQATFTRAAEIPFDDETKSPATPPERKD